MLIILLRPAALTGWGLDVFTYSYHWWVVPILATHTGAIIGAWIYYLAIGMNLSYDMFRQITYIYLIQKLISRLGKTLTTMKWI